MLFTARIKELEGQLTAALAERDSATAALATITTERDQLADANAQCKTQYDADQATIGTLTTERDEALQRATTVEANIETEVTRRIAAAGGDPIKRDPAVIDNPSDATGKGRTATTWGRDFTKTTTK